MSASQRQEFCVRWNSHLGSIGAAFPQLLAGQRFVDVTLACEGHQVHCHRLVLAACSSYFDSILAENPCKHPVIILPSEIKLWEIQALVDFMYKGEVNVTQAGLPQLLRCAEQLRIRGLYGSDAALNLNQLKALTSKAAVAAAAAANALHAGSGATNDSIETDDTATNSTTATAASALQQLQASGMTAQELQHHQQQQQQQQQQQAQLMIKKELPALHAVALQQQQQQQQSNGTMGHNALQQNHLQQQLQLQHQHQQQQQQQQQLKHATQGLTHVANAAAAVAAGAATLTSHSNAASEEADSGDDSTSNTYDEYEKYMLQQKLAAAGKLNAAAAMDSTIEDDHNYVAAHDEDSSYCASADTEHETSANSSTAALLQQAGGVDATGSIKRVRRSEASLAQAAKCVSKGQTFQTVSNMFNIPVSTIRFYMARKGILPRRKRGRGASSANNAATNSAAHVTAAAMSQALAQMKRSDSPTAYQQLAGGAAYKLAG